MKCTQCGFNNEEGAKFCSGCGSHLSTTACPKCGQSISDSAAFCRFCGYAFNKHAKRNPLPIISAIIALFVMLSVLWIFRSEIILRLGLSKSPEIAAPIGLTPTDVPVVTVQPTQAPAPTKETLPNQPVPAGTPVIFEGWSLALSPVIETTADSSGKKAFGISFTVRNMTDNSRVFRYIKGGLTVKDNLGNEYKFSNCEQADHIWQTFQMTIAPSKSENLYSGVYYGCSHVKYFPVFLGAIPINADKLIVSINDWASFTGIEFYIDL